MVPQLKELFQASFRLLNLSGNNVGKKDQVVKKEETLLKYGKDREKDEEKIDKSDNGDGKLRALPEEPSKVKDDTSYETGNQRKLKELKQLGF